MEVKEHYVILRADGYFFASREHKADVLGCAKWYSRKSDATRAARNSKLPDGWSVMKVPVDDDMALCIAAPAVLN